MSYFLMESDRVVILPERGRVEVCSGSSYFGPIRATDDIAKELSFRAGQRAAPPPPPRALPRLSDDGAFDEAAATKRQRDVLYSLNKREVFRRAVAYCELRVSMKFLAFYSVSFPAGIEESVIVRIWNNVLTRWRQELGLRSYLWVAELQENGTRHYHMLTNDWMSIRKANAIAAAAIDGEVQRGNAEWGSSSVSRYNGVDVKRVCGGRSGISSYVRDKVVRKVCRYLVKYMGKGNTTSAYRLWHCSRVVSALVVKAWLSDADFEFASEAAIPQGKECRTFENEWCSIIFAPYWQSDEYRYYIERVNNCIWDYAVQAGWL